MLCLAYVGDFLQAQAFNIHHLDDFIMLSIACAGLSNLVEIFLYFLDEICIASELDQYKIVVMRHLLFDFFADRARDAFVQDRYSRKKIHGSP